MWLPRERRRERMQGTPTLSLPPSQHPHTTASTARSTAGIATTRVGLDANNHKGRLGREQGYHGPMLPKWYTCTHSSPLRHWCEGGSECRCVALHSLLLTSGCPESSQNTRGSKCTNTYVLSTYRLEDRMYLVLEYVPVRTSAGTHHGSVMSTCRLGTHVLSSAAWAL
jgi:hypothetical protein